MSTQDEIDRNVSQQLGYINNKEYQARFLLTPDIQDNADFSHIDKNTAITNLKQRVKGEIDEVGQARMILQGRHVLNNPKYYIQVVKSILIGHKEEENAEQKIILKPIYEERKVDLSMFPRTSHMLNAMYYSFVITASARNGHRIDKAITNRLEKEETLSDQTDIKPKWKPFGAGRQEG